MRESKLETEVNNYIEATWPYIKLLKNQRIIKKTKKSRYEIDIFLPELLLGFEVQDFATHSREEIKAKNPWGKAMKTPLYHARKQHLAYEQLGVRLIELWEDEILSGAFKLAVKEAITLALSKRA